MNTNLVILTLTIITGKDGSKHMQTTRTTILLENVEHTHTPQKKGGGGLVAVRNKDVETRNSRL